jgi:hypothetical protein
MEEEKLAERRQNPRFSPAVETFGKVKATIQAKILDVSSGGIHVELAAALPPAAECEIALPVESGELRVRARVRRCRATALPSDGETRGGMVFRAGLEFIGLNDAQTRELLQSYGPEPTPEAQELPRPAPTENTSAPVLSGKKVEQTRPTGATRKGPIKIRINTELIKGKISED